jgi:methionyl aminopeptidase
MFYPYEKFEQDNFFGANKINTDITIPDINGDENTLESLVKGGKIHYNVRKEIQKILKPGLSVKKLAETIESNTKKFTKRIGMNQGVGFPSSLSVSNCVAHYTPYSNKDIILTKNDNIKIDFGVVVNGWIVDCAFSAYFDHKYDNLHKAVKEATYNGIKNASVDVNIKDWSESNKEVMESHEIELNGKTYTIKPIRNLGGHNIKKGKIHGGEFLPCDPRNYSSNKRFNEGVYAIETFGTYGDNIRIATENKMENSIYMWDFNNYRNLDKLTERLNMPQKTIDFILKMKKQFKTLPFCDRFLNKIDPKFKNHMKYLKKINIVRDFPPLYCKNMSAQYEHTIVLSDNKKTIVSKYEDY